MKSLSPAEFLRTTPLRIYAWGAAQLMAYSAYSEEVVPRNSLPEPVDVGDHAGSAISTAPIGVLIGAGIVRIAERFFPNADPRRVQVATMISAGMAGFVINKGVEVVQGEIVDYVHAHPDVIDYATLEQIVGPTGGQVEDPYYGAIGGAAGGMIAKPSAYLRQDSARTIRAN